MTRLRRQTASGPVAWMGSLMHDAQDASGLMYRRNRFYDPASGRFTQEDPIGLAGGVNAYGFAEGDPVSYTDPLGLSACPPDCGWEGDPRNVEREADRLEAIPAREKLTMVAFHLAAAGIGFGIAEGIGAGGVIGWGTRMLGRLGIGGTAGAAAKAANDAQTFIPEGEGMLAVVQDGQIVAQSHVGISHAAFVERTLGTLPEGARVVTIGKLDGVVTALNSYSFYGNQLPAPQEVQTAVRAAFH